MIRRPSDAWPKFILDEFRRLARLPMEVVTLQPDPDDNSNHFKCAPAVDSFWFDCCTSGQDYAGLLTFVRWLKEGPKIANISAADFAALTQVEVNLEVQDFTVPFPTVLFNMPEGKMHSHVFLHKGVCQGNSGQPLPIMIACSVSPDHKHDIVTVMRHHEGEVVEESLGKFYGDVTQDESVATHICLRAACNYALAMSNFGCQSAYLFPAEVEADRKSVAKGLPGKAERAAERLRDAPVLLTLDRSVRLYHREGGHEAGEPTGRERDWGWVRGHWRMQVHGPRNSLRKRIYVAPYMVRADKFNADPGDTTTTYEK